MRWPLRANQRNCDRDHNSVPETKKPSLLGRLLATANATRGAVGVEMESLVVQLTVPNFPLLNEDAKVALMNTEGLNTLPPKPAEDAWGGTVPTQVCFIAQIQDSAVFFTEDWVVTIRSRKLIDCVEGMCGILNAFGQEFGTFIGVELSDTHDRRGRSLYDQLDRERTTRRFKEIGAWVISILASGAAGATISYILLEVHNP